MIGVRCPRCGGDTLWRYPHLQWARAHVDLPRRYYVMLHGDGRMLGVVPCEDAFSHVYDWIKENMA